MATFAHTVEIARPVEEVFAFLSEPANLLRWQRSLLAVQPHRRGLLCCGVEVTERRRFLGRELEMTWRCTEHRPCRRSVIESEEGPVPFRGVFELEPAGGRVTRFTWTVETRGAAARLAGPLAARATRDELATNTLRLKHLLEENRA
jgi:ligand-binding SRPBCC domain-containing protein